MRKNKQDKVLRAIGNLQSMGKFIDLEAAHLKALVEAHPGEATPELFHALLSLLGELSALHSRLAGLRVGVARKYEDNSAEALRREFF